MSGPIVRSGPTEQYSSNWEKAFSKKKKKEQPAAKPAAKKSAKKKKKKS